MNDNKNFKNKSKEEFFPAPEQIYTMEAELLRNNLEFTLGKEYDFCYDFNNESFIALKKEYAVESTAGQGTELERALRLLNEYAPRLTHKSDYDNSVAMNSISLLKYCMDKKDCGINCRSKAQIINEMCLSLGIYARKVWIMPNNGCDCHVVNEIWDTQLSKWIMLDITNNEYWVDEKGLPLSILEIRYKGAMQQFCTPVKPNDSIDNLKNLKDKYMGDFLYIIKNMVYMQYCKRYTFGENINEVYLLNPKNRKTEYKKVISQSACEKSPIKK